MKIVASLKDKIGDYIEYTIGITSGNSKQEVKIASDFNLFFVKFYYCDFLLIVIIGSTRVFF